MGGRDASVLLGKVWHPKIHLQELLWTFMFLLNLYLNVTPGVVRLLNTRTEDKHLSLDSNTEPLN